VSGFELTFPPGPRRTCKVRVGPGVLDELVLELPALSGVRLWVLVSDSNVAPLHGNPLAARLRARGLRVEQLDFPAGEASKVRETKALLEDRLLALGAGRDTALLAVGGGVTGDLAGYTAATWQRGVPVVQVPTSLLAMADAAIGGKTAVNLPGAKNLVGAFHQPWGVYADVDVLGTLPDDDYRDGFAEIVKSAVIADLAFFRWLEGTVQPLLRRDAAALSHAIAECVRIKGRVVRRDERESGRRAVLNFGHTVAHAIEAGSQWSVRHGTAVAQGMCVEARLAREELGFPETHRRRLVALLEAFGLPVCLPRDARVGALIAATRRDKKTRAGRVRYALPRRIGRMLPGDEVTLELDDTAVAKALAASH